MKRGMPKNRVQFESAYCACVCAKSNSATLWTVAHQAPLSMGFSVQEYWRGLPCPPPGDSWPRNQTQVSCTAGRFFTIRTIREALCSLATDKNLNQFHSYKCIFLVTRKTGLMKNPSFLLKRNFKHTIFWRWLLSHLSCAQSVVSNSFATAWTVAGQPALSMGFSQQEYGSGLPFPSPGDHPHPGIKPIPTASPALAGGFFTTEPPGKEVLLRQPCKDSNPIQSWSESFTISAQTKEGR